MTDDYLQRFGGIARLYGTQALACFNKAHIMVIGLGGVGSWTVEALTRSGIGKISLVDLDDLCITNTNRQIHATTATIGQSKASALAARMVQINPEVTTTVHQQFYRETNATELLLSDAPDLVVDAIDSVRPKCHLLVFCREHQIPVICSGGAGGRIDPTRVEMSDLSRTYGDSLLQSVRRRLRSEYRFPKAGKKQRKFGIQAVFSSEEPRFPTCDGGISSERPAEMPGSIKCDAGYGAATHVTATFGNTLAAWILSQLSQESNPQ